ncbi:D-alanyl-D-alanine carboxypeptidase/D-alanyl-D-alanine endopeptidase, partial [Streptomyces bikiniensis]
SAPLADLVERTLTHSDNDLAEALARQTALARELPASFDGAGKAVRAELARLGLPVTGTRFADGSGLDRDDRVSAALLTGLLTRAADPARPALRPLLTGLPVGGFTGTLTDRFDTAPAGAGLVRAKTGTLTGVNTLAGTVATPDGRLLAFAFLAGRTPSPYQAQPALDRLSAALTGQDPS